MYPLRQQPLTRPAGTLSPRAERGESRHTAPLIMETVPTGIVAQTLMPLGPKKTFTELVGKPE